MTTYHMLPTWGQNGLFAIVTIMMLIFSNNLVEIHIMLASS